MAARAPSGRISRDWWQRRAPKEEGQAVLFRLRRARWVMNRAFARHLFNVLYVIDPVLWRPGRSSTMPNPLLLKNSIRPEALDVLRWMRHDLAWQTKLVDE